LCKNLHGDVKFIRQKHHWKCEIVGCHKSEFENLFHFPCKYDHVEKAYETVIKDADENHILTLPILTLPEKTERGNGCFYENL
jgi:hypothetical protein